MTEKMTPRREQIARLAVAGLSRPQIAQSLKISPKTVQEHLRRVFRATCTENRAELAMAIGEKYVPLPQWNGCGAPAQHARPAQTPPKPAPRQWWQV